MGFVELLLTAVGLSMDAFAVSVTIGLSLKKPSLKHALIPGLYFGAFQAAMPLVGFFAARLFADKITAYSGWIAFILLAFIGGRMIIESLERDKESGSQAAGAGDKEPSLGPAKMLPLAIATSIDALAVGVSFAFLQVSIVPAVLLIGATTCALATAGVKIGGIFGARFKSKAEFAGGAILLLLSIKILLEHLNVLHL
ncbi:MAG: manganese efflux pump MntP family protein [Coriobacteriia bacterium]|nr:manganese efflux pump MntP family protein [Coriobacteriia bacterium]